jgi:hypothetical protein
MQFGVYHNFYANGVLIAQHGIQTTATQGLVLHNDTPSLIGTQAQHPPLVDFIGHGWIAIPGEDRYVRFRNDLRITGGTPSSTLAWSSSVDSGTASFTDRMTLTSAGVLALPGLTAGRVVYTGTGGALSVDAGITYDAVNDELALPTSGSAAGLIIGTDFKIYRRTTNIGATASGDSFEVASNLAVGTTIDTTYQLVSNMTTSTSVSSSAIRGVNTISGATSNVTPTGGNFRVDISSGSFAVDDGATGLTGTVRDSSSYSGTVGAWMGLDYNVFKRGSGAITDRFTGLRSLATFDSTSSGNVTNAAGAWAEFGTTSGSTVVFTNECMVFRAGGAIAAAGQTMPTLSIFNANGLEFSNNAPITTLIHFNGGNSSGANTAITNHIGYRQHSNYKGNTSNYGFLFDGTPRTAQHGIWWGTLGSADVNIFSNATNSLTVSSNSAGTGAADLKATRSLYAATSVLSPLFTSSTAVALTVRGYDNSAGAGQNITVRGGNAGGISGNGGNVLIYGGNRAGAATYGSVAIYKIDGTTKRIESNETGLGFFAATPVAQDTGWSVSNVTADRVFDANSTTIDEIADVLGTLINQLKNLGLIGA